VKLNRTPRANIDPDTERFYKEIAQQVNALSEGTLAANYNALTTAPTSGTYAKGDVVKNSNPSELGTALSKYVVTGWICTVGGTPGTWLPMRTLTGN
jgi:hypothetical protein